MTDDTLAGRELDELEDLASEFARIGGAEIMASLERIIHVAYKGEDPGVMDDPVSEVDRHVETLVRARIAQAHPDHHVIGEEFGARTDVEHPIVWAIDPVDGTANFVNGMPLFSASIGVLHHGVPVAGAVWCSTSHALRPGVFSARRGGRLSFDGRPVERLPNPAVRRRIVALPRAGDTVAGFEGRTLGSAAIECAFVAAGLLAGARFRAPNVWDVAGGIPLVEAAGCAVEVRDDAGLWQPLDGFHPRGGLGNAALANWRKPVVLGAPDAVAALIRGD